MNLRVIIGALVVVALVGGTAWATELGDPAPALKIKEWVKGDKVDLKEGKDKKIFVIEFWATWCGPCRVSIPHLTEMQKQYKDKGVVVIGISDETTDKVKPFVEKMGKDMDYVVALDDEKKTNEAYMKAFKQNGIPTAFVVDKTGALVWYGHPMDGLDKVLEQLAAGKFDAKATKKAIEEREKSAQDMEKISEKLNEYFTMCSKGKKADAEKAEKLGNEIFETGKKNAMLMNALAWTILTEERIKNRDLKLAMKAAKAALDVTEGKDAAILDTYARALFDTDKKAEAIEYQKKAVAACKDNAEMKKELEATLKKYEKGDAKADKEEKKEDKKAEKKGEKDKDDADDEEEDEDEDEDEGKDDDEDSDD